MNTLEQIIQHDQRAFYLAVGVHFLTFPALIQEMVKVYETEGLITQYPLAHIGIWLLLGATMTIFPYVYTSAIMRPFNKYMSEETFIKRRLKIKIKQHFVLIIGFVLVLMGVLGYYSYLLSDFNNYLQVAIYLVTIILMALWIFKLWHTQKYHLEHSWKPLLQELEMQI